MCGIVGVFDSRGKHQTSEETLARMCGTIVHRGPDSSGMYRDRDVALGFRRLSIIDLAGGAQPMYSPDRSVVLICNGEIFNYAELREEMEARQHTFSTNCDVEVIILLYLEYGIDFLNRLRGQFAFALYDSRKRQLILARDQMGILPLHYTVIDGTLIFGSEIKALLAHPAVKPRVNLTGLDQVFCLPGVVSPMTLFEGVQSLPAGYMLLVQGGEIRLKQYWDLEFPRLGEASYDHSEEYYVSRLRELLVNSVKARLRSDVPVGCYLSGGLDSSLIAGIVKANTRSGLPSFSVKFRQAHVDESPYQMLVSRHLHTRHQEILCELDDIAARLPEMIYHCECPVKESYNTCSMALAEATKAAGITVILTGEGADELFAGYVGYRFDGSGMRGAAMDDYLSQAWEEEMRERVWGDKNLFYEEGFQALAELREALYSPAVQQQIADFDCFQHPLVDPRRLDGRHPIHQRSYLDFKLRLSDHLLSDHGDRMAMSRSVEARYPFLDLDVVEFASTVPPDLKLRGMTEKYIVKRVAQEFVPRQIIQREKFGFHAPGSPYLLRQKIEWIQDLLSYDRIKRQGYFNADCVEALKKQYASPGFSINTPFEQDVLMIVLTFGIFLEAFHLPNY